MGGRAPRRGRPTDVDVHRDVPAAATWGLLVAFAVHDAEELATMSRWSHRRYER